MDFLMYWPCWEGSVCSCSNESHGQLPGKVCRQQSEGVAEQTDFPQDFGIPDGVGRKTMVIQSSSATTVMVVGFSELWITFLRQAIGVIMVPTVCTNSDRLDFELDRPGRGKLLSSLLEPTSFSLPCWP